MESPFKYIHEQFIKGNSFGTMEELNRRGREFVNSWCDRMHTTTRRIPNQHYLLEEKQALLPLPKKHYRHKELQPRIVSPDSYVSIDTNKYSVPVSYVGKTLYYRMVYGFRIELYDRNENPIMKMERSYEKHDVRTDKGHYAEIAVPFSTSIPQIRRDFTAMFPSGKAYLDAAGRKFDQPTHHARRILLLTDLYDAETLDRFIRYSIIHDKMDIKSFKELLREYNAGRLALPDPDGGPGEKEDDIGAMAYRDDDPALTRDCSYYEENVGTEVAG